LTHRDDRVALYDDRGNLATDVLLIAFSPLVNPAIKTIISYTIQTGAPYYLVIVPMYRKHINKLLRGAQTIIETLPMAAELARGRINFISKFQFEDGITHMPVVLTSFNVRHQDRPH
jgi:hypothetical protein